MNMRKNEQHSDVYYIFKNKAFNPVREAKSFHNSLGLDLFQYHGFIYEGRTGLRLCTMQESANLESFVERHGGLESLQKLISDSLKRTGLSPRYAQPDKRKKDVFPPKVRDESRLMAKDLMGNRHFYWRIYNENGIELYTRGTKRDEYQTVYVLCDGFMVGIGQQNRLESVLKWLSTLEHGIRGEIERLFNQNMKDPGKWVNPGFANLLGRHEEAVAHNAPILEKRQLQEEQRKAAHDELERQRKQDELNRYTAAIREAEQDILHGREVVNREINGKALIMQLFREHGISVPLKTQGWIINTLHSIRYSPGCDQWSYQYRKGSRKSTKLFELLPCLLSAIQSKVSLENSDSDNSGSPTPESGAAGCHNDTNM